MKSKIELKDIEKLLKKLPHSYQVSFALHCAESCFNNLTPEQKPIVRSCLDLVTRWLNGEAVSSTELYSAAHSANSAAYSANSTANSANSAYSAASAASSATHSTYSANNAANSAAYSAYSAANAASASNAAHSAAYKERINEFYLHLKEMTKGLTRLERELYEIKD